MHPTHLQQAFAIASSKDSCVEVMGFQCPGTQNKAICGEVAITTSLVNEQDSQQTGVGGIGKGGEAGGRRKRRQIFIIVVLIKAPLHGYHYLCCHASSLQYSEASLKQAMGLVSRARGCLTLSQSSHHVDSWNVQHYNRSGRPRSTCTASPMAKVWRVARIVDGL